MRQKIPRMIHQLDRNLSVLDPDVHVQSKNKVCARHQLHIFHNVLVALIRINFLGPPVGKRMRRGRGQPQSIFFRQSNHVAAKFFDLFFGILDRGAHRRPHFDHRLMHLRFYPLLQDELPLLDDLGVNVRTQVPGYGIDCLIFLFNPDREGWFHSALPLVPTALGGGHGRPEVRARCPSV